MDLPVINIPADRQPGFWTSPNMTKDIDWTFISDSDILIKSGQFKDIVYRYNKVKIYEKEVDGEMTGVLEFDFTIKSVHEEYSSRVTEALEKDQDFQKLAGDILCTLLQNDEIRIGEEKINGETGNDNT